MQYSHYILSVSFIIFRTRKIPIRKAKVHADARTKNKQNNICSARLMTLNFSVN